jgi:hypothetical protein
MLKFFQNLLVVLGLGGCVFSLRLHWPAAAAPAALTVTTEANTDYTIVWKAPTSSADPLELPSVQLTEPDVKSPSSAMPAPYTYAPVVPGTLPVSYEPPEAYCEHPKFKFLPRTRTWLHRQIHHARTLKR